MIAGAVWYLGIFQASERCWQVIEDQPTEAYSGGPEGQNLCIVERGSEIAEVHNMSDWDLTEPAVALAGIGAGFLAGWLIRLAGQAASGGRN